MEGLNWQEIRALLQALDQSSVVEFNLEVEGFRLNLRKGETVPPGSDVSSTPQPVAPDDISHEGNSKQEPTQVPATVDRPASDPSRSQWVEVISPMVGTYYSAPAPGEPDFIQKGDRVRKGQTLCILEAMKLMNEIEAEVEGQIAEILVSNSESVEFGQVLIRINPSA